MTPTTSPTGDPDEFDALDLAVQHEFIDALPELGVDFLGDRAPRPELVVFNHDLAEVLGLGDVGLDSPAGAVLLSGGVAPVDGRPVAMAYAGHQFGGYSPRLGDGRALLLGEVCAADGTLTDIHLKGSGRTPFSRGGDGKATLASMLREYLMAEAMHALGVPTMRALSVVATGEQVPRTGYEPGAVLARTGSSHIRVGTFQYARALEVEGGGGDLVRRLADHAIERHHPTAAQAANRYLALFEAVVEAQASLVAQFMQIGFIHGVLNTDNVLISGEAIDYGPCAFVEGYEPLAVFSSIDHGGRYAFGNQPPVMAWNLARFAETLLGLFSDDQEEAVEVATEVLQSFPGRNQGHWLAGLRAKLGDVTGDDDLVVELVDDLFTVMHEHRADFTNTFRALAQSLRGDDRALDELIPAATLASWRARWYSVLGTGDRAQTAARMDAVNPRIVPRNHLVDQALQAATTGDLQPFRDLLAVVTEPFSDDPDLEHWTTPAPVEFTENHKTYCGT